MALRKYLAIIDNGHDTAEIIYSSYYKNGSRVNMEDATTAIPTWRKKQGFVVKHTILLKHTIYG